MSTNAEKFCDAMAARRWFLANDPCGMPAGLHTDAIRSRHLQLASVRAALRIDDTGPDRSIIEFADGSNAWQTKSMRWEAGS